MKVYKLIEDKAKIWETENIKTIESIDSMLYKLETYHAAKYYVKKTFPSITEALVECDYGFVYPFLIYGDLLIFFDDEKNPKEDSGAEQFSLYHTPKREVTHIFVENLDRLIFDSQKLNEIRHTVNENDYSELCRKYWGFDWHVKRLKSETISQQTFFVDY